MPMLRTIKRDWKAVLGVGFILAGLAVVLHDIWRALSSGILEFPFVWLQVSYELQPIWFFAGIAFLVVLAICASLFLIFVLIVVSHDWRAQKRFFQKRASQPVIDNTRRGAID